MDENELIETEEVESVETNADETSQENVAEPEEVETTAENKQNIEKTLDFLKGKIKVYSKEKWFKYVVIALALVLAFAIIKPIVSKTSQKKESKAKLEKVAYQITDTIKMSKLSVLEVPCRGIMEANYNGDFVGYLHYKGKVTLGIDFDKIEVEVKDGKLVVTLPAVCINDSEVEDKDIEYIYDSKAMQKEYSADEDYYVKAKQLCKENLSERCSRENNPTLYERSEENIKNLITSLTKPIAEKNGCELTVEFKTEG